MALQDHFKQITFCNPHLGNSILLWHDKWRDDQESLQSAFPQLFSFAKDKSITLQKDVQSSQHDIYEMFKIPLSIIASEQCISLQNMLQQPMNGSNEYKDEWKLPGKNIKYPTKKCICLLSVILLKLHLHSNGFGNLLACRNRNSCSGF